MSRYRNSGVNTGIHYRFRKLEDGTWQRKADGGRWETLHTRLVPPDVPEGRRDRDVAQPSAIWTWT